MHYFGAHIYHSAANANNQHRKPVEIKALIGEIALKQKYGNKS